MYEKLQLQSNVFKFIEKHPNEAGFHAHFTLSNKPKLDPSMVNYLAKALGNGKVTPIHLWDGERFEHDFMLTTHLRNNHVANASLEFDEKYRLILAAGIEVLRAKMEAKIPHNYAAGQECRNLVFTRMMYGECHMKIGICGSREEYGYISNELQDYIKRRHPTWSAFSENSLIQERSSDTFTLYATKRFHSGSVPEAQERIRYFSELLLSVVKGKNYPVKIYPSMSLEKIVYDSHPEHDDWWTTKEVADD